MTTPDHLGLVLKSSDTEIQNYLQQRGWWNRFVAVRDDAHRRGHFHWGLFIADTNGDLHALVGLSGHPRPDDNGYLWYYLPSPHSSEDTKVNALCRVLEQYFQPAAGIQFGRLDFRDIKSGLTTDSQQVLRRGKNDDGNS